MKFAYWIMGIIGVLFIIAFISITISEESRYGYQYFDLRHTAGELSLLIIPLAASFIALYVSSRLVVSKPLHVFRVFLAGLSSYLIGFFGILAIAGAVNLAFANYAWPFTCVGFGVLTAILVLYDSISRYRLSK